MATPRDNPSELSGRQSAELIRDLLDTKHPQSYMLFSVDQYHRNHPSYRKELFHNRVCLKFFCKNIWYFILNLGYWFTIIWWKTFSTFNWFDMSLSKNQFIFTWIIIEYSCTSLFCKEFSINFNQMITKIFLIGRKKSSSFWSMCIDRISWDISTSWSYCSILWITSLCTSIINNVTKKV